VGGRLKLGQILLSKELISPEQLASALGEQERWGSRLGMTLVRMGFIEEEALIRVLAGQLRLPVARIRGKSVNSDVLEFVPVELAEKYRCLPLFVREEGGAKTLFLAMEDPSDLEAMDELAFRIGQKLRPVLVAPTELEDALQRHYHGATLMGGCTDALPPVRVSQRPDPEEAETAPELPPLDTLLAPELEPSAVDSDPDPDPEPEPAPEPDSLSGAALDPQVAPADEADSDRELSQGLEARVILRALAQLLVEKGVISRDELAERLRSIAAEERSRRET
jgi:type IV pilus assembly protein PilB